MEILLPTGHRQPRTGRWTTLAFALLVPPLVCWAALLLHLWRPGATPADLLFEQLSLPVKVGGMAVSPALAAGIGLAVRRRAASDAAKIVARAVALCGAALVVLAVLAALRPS
jgi:hypothetical protein